jgi:hypothetical protein
MDHGVASTRRLTVRRPHDGSDGAEAEVWARTAAGDVFVVFDGPQGHKGRYRVQDHP